jgi:3-deoxy-7-phosphoheptulonate synthase
MLVVMSTEATPAEVAGVVTAIERLGFSAHPIPGAGRTAIGVTGNEGPIEPDVFTCLPGVLDAISVSQPFKLVSREVKHESSLVQVGDLTIGGDGIVVMAGPCAVETRAQIRQCAEAAKRSGAQVLRGGAFKPRTSPYSFQGLKEEGLKILAEARDETGLKIVTEVVDAETVPLVAAYADILQIGARNMQNFTLLEAVGRLRKPVLLKRGMSATIKEYLMAGEYIAKGGNYQIILCERGIRTFETMTRNTLDLSAVPVLKGLSHLPVLVDPSHGIGRRDGVTAMARAAIAAGADGLIVEIHPDPQNAMSDGPQSLTLPMFADLMVQVRRVAQAVDRSL